MDDQSILSRIEKLVAEEHALQSDEAARAETTKSLDADRERLRTVSLELDRCWDLLRRRRALRESGGDPDDATARDTETVERYLQ
jgi:hypothetical protein